MVASCRSLRNILDLAVTSSGEILVLETPRSVVRLGRCEDSLAPDLSPSSPYSTRPRQIYTGHFIKEVRQWEDLLVARTSNSDLLLARLELLAEEEAWQPLLVCAETETAQLAVLGFDISQAGELWVVGRGVREVTTQFLLSSVERVSSLVCSRLHAGEGRRPTLATSCSS